MAGTDRAAAGREADLALLARWVAAAAAFVLLGLLLAARAGDAYTEAVGFLFAGFGVLLGFRLIGRATP